MYKMTNIDTLGTDYTVADQTGKVIKNVQIIPHTEILEAALGPYNDSFGNIKNYLEKSIAVLEGNEDIDISRVYWYSTEDDEVVLSEIIEYAINNGYDKIILEHLDTVDE